MPSLNSGVVESVQVKLPAVDEQRAIRLLIDDADAEVEVLRSRLAKAKAVKHGMLQQLLSGRTRLSVGEVGS